jgi:hypothetical protein
MTEVADDSPGVLVVGTGFGCRIQVPALPAQKTPTWCAFAS